MKQIYQAPFCIVTEIEAADILTLSTCDSHGGMRIGWGEESNADESMWY